MPIGLERERAACGGGTAPAPRRAAARPLTRTSTVAKELVHRAAVAEVLLTDWQRVDDTHFTVAAQWPRSHSFFTPIDGEYHDPLMAAETIRQVGSLLAHAEFGVPFDHHFLLWDLALTVRPDQLRIRQTPASLHLEITCTEVKRRGGVLTGLRYEARVLREGHEVATGGLSYTCAGPAVYRRVRPDRALSGEVRALPLTAPAAPQSVGRTSPVDVVLSPDGRPGRWRLRVDTRHPVLFDHPVDHVPGMVLLEAARQAAAAALGRSTFLPLSFDNRFTRYAELDVPCVIEAHRLYPATPGAAAAVEVTGHQDGALVFSSTVTAAAGGE
ncbi:ScbA/BarX family gamma-butyrolactone biosynthesis protein [Streptomyces sp. NPDC089919]|uniref:ScbA/BarX family gamma-butyrolactone biosynthesis protein n=1 Tax=Streptomyces sp. NPDC089919 TaxID=3155188 RepID=UPI0034288CE9